MSQTRPNSIEAKITYVVLMALLGVVIAVGVTTD